MSVLATVSLLGLYGLLGATAAGSQTIGAPVAATLAREPRLPASLDRGGPRPEGNGLVAPFARDTSMATPLSLRRAPNPGYAGKDRRPTVWKYVGIGALVGGTVGVGTIAYLARDCGERDACWFLSAYLAGGFGIGAVVGGLVGSMIYAGRYWSSEP
jgi:hypothetical protein